MKKRLRESDPGARLGGDACAIILEGLSRAQDAARVAQDLLERLSEPFASDGHEIAVGASLGIAVWPSSGDDRLLRDADAAMYRAKRRGGNNFQRDLRRALHRGWSLRRSSYPSWRGPV
jgi:diguanylate cyclase (GGDEF)-like protein